MTRSTSLLPGDIDLDGDVDRTDAALFSQHFGTTSGSIWATGDFDADGRTTLADWGLLQTHLGQSVPSPATSLSAAVPEPASFTVAVLGALGILLAVRRRAIVRTAFSILVLAAVLGAAGSSAAATKTWDRGGGNSNWSVGSNWSSAFPNNNTEPTLSDDVIFPTPIPAGDTTIDLSAGEVADTLTFNAAYSLNGGGLTLGSGGVAVDTGVSAVINSALDGTNGLTKLGEGRLGVFNAGNAFTGEVSVNQGILTITADAHLGDAANGVTLSGGTLQVNGNVSTSRTFTMGAAGGTIAAGATFTINSALAANANALTSDGLGTLVLTAASTRSGSTDVQNGMLRMNEGSALGTGSIDVDSSGVLELGSVNVAQALNLGSGGTVRAAGSATYSGVISVVGGVTVGLNGGTIAAHTLTIGDSPNDYTGGSGSTTVISGISLSTSHVTLPFANDYAGNWQIDSGILRIADAGALGTGTSPVTISNGMLDVDSVALARDLSMTGGYLRGRGSSGVTGTINLASGADINVLAIVGSGVPQPPGVLTLGSNLTGGGGGSSITVELGKIRTPPNSYIGDWIVTGGSLEIDSDAELGDAANTVTLNGGALATTGTFSSGSRVLTIGPFGGQIDSAGTFTLSTALQANANAFTSGGTGTLILTSASSRTGLTTIKNGVVHVNHSSALGSGTLNVNSGGVLEFGATAIFLPMPVNLGQGGTIRVPALTGGQFSDTITAADGASSLTFESGAAGTGSLTIGAYAGGTGSTTIVTGSGFFLLPNPTTYAGSWQLTGGTTRLNNAASLGTGDSPVQVSNSIMELLGYTFTRPVTLNNGATLRAFGAHATTTGEIHVAPGANVTLGGAAITNTQSLTIGDSANDLTGGGGGSTITVSTGANGKLVLNQPSDYTGNWTVPFGSTLEIGADDRLGDAANTLTLSGGLLRATGTFSSNRPMTLAPNSARIDVTPGNTLTVNGAVGGTASLTKLGTGTLVLAAASARTGDTNVNAGTLRLQHASAAGSGLISNLATLEIANVPIGNQISLVNGSTLRGTGTASVNNVGIEGLSSNVTLATGTSSGDVLTLSNAIGGGANGSITVAGSGTVVLASPSNYAGNWTIAASTLVAQSGLVVNSGKTLAGSGTVGSPNSPATAMIVSGAVQGNSAAEPLTFTGYVKGTGTFDHVVFAGTFSPGLSPAVVNLGSATYAPAGTLLMEIGGPTPGTDHDQLIHSGTATLGGTLALSLDAGFAPSWGDSFDILDWGSISGTFDTLALPLLSAGLSWNTAQLYVTGILSVVLAGDFNFDGAVDAADYVVWRKNGGTLAEFDTWRANFGQTAGSGSAAAGASPSQTTVPEPAAISLLIVGLLLLTASYRK